MTTAIIVQARWDSTRLPGKVMADVAVSNPANGTIEIAGPERVRLSDLVARYLEATGERVLRTTLEQALGHPRQLMARLHAAGAPYTDRQP